MHYRRFHRCLTDHQNIRFAIVVILFMLASTGFVSAKNAGLWVEHRLLVKPRSWVSSVEFENILQDHKGQILKELGPLGIHLVELPPTANELMVAEALSQNPLIQFAELDRRYPLSSVEADDPYYADAWHLSKIEGPLAWDLSLGTGIVVAVLDTGVAPSHPDLAGKLIDGWNFYDDNADWSDVYGHGTKVAGVIGAVSDNGLGVTSVAWNTMILPVRISGPDGWASTSRIAEGLYWAADQGAHIANISYAVSGSSTILAAADYMKSKGGLVVVAGGNSGNFESFAPSASVISVSATNSNDSLTSWSSYGDYIDVSAPGAGIWTTKRDGGYGSPSGTSFSSPLVAGVLALIRSINPLLEPSEVESILFSSSDDLGSEGYDIYFGAGRVNAYSAAEEAASRTGVDTQSPSVAIASPSENEVVSDSILVKVAASDNVGVFQVDLAINGQIVGSSSAAPHEFNWDTSELPDGEATLVAFAIDAAGNEGISPAVTVLIENESEPAPDTTAPTVSVTSPADSDVTVSGTITVSVEASDDVGVAQVEVYVGDVLIGTDTEAPYDFIWDTTQVADGNVTLTANASDTAGNIGSTSLTVNVENQAEQDNTPPVVAFLTPAAGSSVNGNVKIEITASDESSVLNLRLYVDDVLWASGSGSSLSTFWHSKDASPGGHTLRAEADDAAGNTGTVSITVMVEDKGKGKPGG